ncbi:MAG: hypothetical protein FWH18_00295 [Marinilabiliaceae bacterium]|nr:hypothetical protein [Marinilabiliaceae bacterium]
MKQTIFVFIATLLFCGVVAAQNQNEHEGFLNAQFLILDEVQPLTQVEREQMKNIFYEEIAESGFRNIAFNIAMSKTLENPDYYLVYFQDEIAKRAWTIYHEDLGYYLEEMELNDSTLESISGHLKERSENLALVEMYFLGIPEDLFAVKEDVKLKYEKQISDVYIRNDSKGASYKELCKKVEIRQRHFGKNRNRQCFLSCGQYQAI